MLNKQIAMKTQKNALEKTKEGTDLAYNSARLREVLIGILTSQEYIEMRDRLYSMSDDQISKTYQEREVRLFCQGSLLLTGDGQRPHVFANMKIGEFLNPTNTDGTYVVYVEDHKTASHHGACPVPFIDPKMYRITRKFINTFRFVHST